MKNSASIFQNVAAKMLLGIYLAFWMLLSLHHFIEHQEFSICDLDKPHLHQQGHGHFSCDLCQFHFAPSDFQTDVWQVPAQNIVFEKAFFTYKANYFALSARQFCLRGPPTLAV